MIYGGTQGRKIPLSATDDKLYDPLVDQEHHCSTMVDAKGLYGGHLNYPGPMPVAGGVFPPWGNDADGNTDTSTYAASNVALCRLLQVVETLDSRRRRGHGPQKMCQ